MAESGGYGIILLNMGGPGSLDEVNSYLQDVFSDPDMIRLPLGFLYRKALARWIAARRAPSVVEKYRSIGGRSPLFHETARQAVALEKLTGIPSFFAMRFSQPRVSKVLAECQNRSICKLIAIPLYPQYSFATTRSSLRDLQRNLPENVAVRMIENHHDNEGYIEALLQKQLQAMKMERDGNMHVLLAAHSIPVAYTRAGDPYIAQIRKTAVLLQSRMNPAWTVSIAFQSKIGPVKWHGPSLAEELARLTKTGISKLIVHPVSFVSENLETLYDLDIEFKNACKAKGIIDFIRIPALGASEPYIQALAGMALDEIAKWKAQNA
jgi:protoporphyrin/coproporphyrin ferrochelatase